MTLSVVPELICSDVSISTSYFVDVLEFDVKYERPNERFVYLTRGGVNLMLEGICPTGRQWITGDLEAPFGRGINFEWEVENINELYTKVKKLAPETIYLPIENKKYLCGGTTIVQRQFIVQVPDGYLFRFCQE